MTYAGEGDREQRFVGQCDEFIDLAVQEMGAAKLSDIPPMIGRLALPLRPIVIEDFRVLNEATKLAIKTAYFGEYGVAYCIVLNAAAPPVAGHPLLDLARQLVEQLELRFPLDHPMEGHPEAVSRFGPPDGTLKLYDLASKDGSTGYREQAETSETFAAHNDGLGYGGAVRTAIFYLDRPPLWGGFTYFQNLVRLCIELAKEDREAFRALFLPDALTAIRPRGKGAIKVVSPILFLNEERKPGVFYRVSSGEYRMTWRAGNHALDRAREFLDRHSRPFSPGSTFVHLVATGHCCFVRNQSVVHGRTAFIDGPLQEQRRVLARKWFMSGARHTRYKHVPGMYICEDYARLYPELFGPEQLEGEWNYDQSLDKNRRLR